MRTVEQIIEDIKGRLKAGYDIEYDRVLDLLFEEITGLSPEEVERLKRGGWIPVSERLPEADDKTGVRSGYVIVDYDGGKVGLGMYDYEMRLWSINHNFSHNIRAWQPLPKPYKECD